MMPQVTLPFQYQSEKNTSGLTGFAGLPLYLELAIKSGFTQYIQETLNTKARGWTDTEMILSLLWLNLTGGDCISDIERLEQDAGLRTLLMKFATQGMQRQQRRDYEKRWRKTKARGLPSNAALHRYLAQFHSPEEEKKRVVGEAFIPAPNTHLQSLIALNKPLIACIQSQFPKTQATLDQDATLVHTYKQKAYYSYKKYKAYQPFNTYWAEQGLLLHSEFRDGNVPAGYEQLRVFKEALSLLPDNVTQVFLRSDCAGYQAALLHYCAEGQNARFGVIEFAIAARVTQAFKHAVRELKPEAWQPLYQTQADGSRIQTHQEWAEVNFVPNWAGYSKNQAPYRYLALREALPAIASAQETETLPFQTIQDNTTTYKLFAVVTNRDIDGHALLQWHRERCGKSEQVHSTQKAGLAGGQLPSNHFGVNAAWWQIMILAYNLNRLMQSVALPSKLQESKMKALRFHVIQLPGRIVYHARQLVIRVGKQANELYAFMRKRIASLSVAPPLLDTS